MALLATILGMILYKKLLSDIIDNKYINPDDGLNLNFPIKYIEIGEDILQKSCHILSNLELGLNPYIICDKNTYQALGNDIAQTLKSNNIIILDNEAKASEEYINKITGQTSDADYLIGVGSGTINDLCKYASYKMGKKYVIFGTALSMNGYSSANASIKIDGCKKSLQAHLPKAIFIDIDVAKNAPFRLTQSGLGDSICRSTAQADWLLSHYLLDTEYNSAPFELTQKCEEVLFNNSGRLSEKDNFTFEALACNLISSGIGMYIAGGSYPASQGEHMLAHYIESKYPDLPHSYHGEQIGVATLIMSEIQGNILQQNKIDNFSDEKWQKAKEEISKIYISTDRLKNILLNAKCKTQPEELDWNKDIIKKAIKIAPSTRDRFTFLNLT